MNNIFGVEVFKCLNYLKYIVSCFDLIKALILRMEQLLVNFSTRGELKDQIDLLLVPEEPIQPANVVVTKVALNFNLSTQSVL